ncbi:hypothetical protein [Flavobacterium hydatis]|uniref:Uncharacterized protein n=1 Tax=Flavobacterium hydatis TaxID=991 RepID=A0A086A925_FLAHY|nr:hypothetical protein [Flavobacterium hydatis]KFF13189.1 hypothetical protein IW20_17985 [Flavobacterium hydatis]OXA94193.1 hypothetical protein B0A62_11075 [Flavobacterium hydatis]
MKKVILMCTVFILFNCKSQSRIDLANLDLKSSLNDLIENKIKHQNLDQTTGLPYYETFKVDKYSFADVNFSIEYPKEKFLKSAVGFLVDNQKDNNLKGFYLSTYNFSETNTLFEALKQKYGEPTTIKIASDSWPYSAFYWKNTAGDFDILLNQVKEEYKVEGKMISGFSCTLYFIEKNLKIGNVTNRENVLDNFIEKNSR